jgi:hypothetical protein
MDAVPSILILTSTGLDGDIRESGFGKDLERDWEGSGAVNVVIQLQDATTKLRAMIVKLNTGLFMGFVWDTKD